MSDVSSPGEKVRPTAPASVLNEDASAVTTEPEHITEQQVRVCPPELALAAIELSLLSETLQRYERQYAQNEGRPTRQQTDAIYETWKKYKMQLSGKQNE